MKVNIKKLVKGFSVSLAIFGLMFSALITPAHAASILTGNYDPANYIHDITISGETKTINYDFSSIRYAFRYWENGDPSTTDYKDNFTVDLHPDATQFVVSCYPFGVVQGSHKLSKGGAVYVGDILPGSPIAFDFLLDVSFEWENRGQPFDISVTYEPVYLLFDDSGSLLDTVNLTKDTVTYTLVSDNENGYTTTLTDVRHISGTIPADASYIVPFYRLRVRNSLQDQMLVTMTVQGGHTSLSVDINAVLDNSNQMHIIQDKLDSILTGTPEQNEDANNAKDELEDKKDQLDDLLDQMQPSKPDTDSIDTDIGAIAGEEATDLLSDGLSPILNHEIILSMLTIVCAVCLVGYVLFGKGG